MSRHSRRPVASALRRAACLVPLLAALGAALPVSTWAQTADAAAFEQAAARFMTASGGATDAIDDAQSRFQQLLAAHPSDPVLRAYAGAATSMQANTTWMPWKKIQYAEDGLAQIDKALAQLGPAHDAPAYRGVPAAMEARFVAAGTFLALPSMFNRNARGRQLLDALLAHPGLAAAPAPFRATVWMRAAQLAAQDGQGAQQRQWLEKVAASGAPQASAAREQLKAL